MRRAGSFFVTLLIMVTLSFSFFFGAYAEECGKVKFMLMDKQGNVLSNEEAIVLRKSGQIIFSEHFIREWISDVENDLKLNPSLEPLKLLYLVGVDNGFITVKVEDEKFWRIEQNSERTSKIKCPTQQVIKKKESFALADLEGKWFQQDNIDDTSKQMVNRYLFFADFEIETGKYQEAKEDLDKAMALWPNNPDVLSRLCKIHLKTGDSENYKLSLIMALKANPFDKQLYFNYLTAAISQLDYASAEKAMKKSFFLYPRDPKVIYHYGIAASLAGDLSLAKALLNRLQRLDPTLARNLGDFIQ